VAASPGLRRKLRRWDVLGPGGDSVEPAPLPVVQLTKPLLYSPSLQRKVMSSSTLSSRSTCSSVTDSSSDDSRLSKAVASSQRTETDDSDSVSENVRDRDDSGVTTDDSHDTETDHSRQPRYVWPRVKDTGQLRGQWDGGVVIETLLMFLSSNVFCQIPSLVSDTQLLLHMWLARASWGASPKIYIAYLERKYSEKCFYKYIAYIHTISKDTAILMSKVLKYVFEKNQHQVGCNLLQILVQLCLRL